MSDNKTVQLIIDELKETQDWVSIAGALGAINVNAFHASPVQIHNLISEVQNSESLRIGTITQSGFSELGADDIAGLASKISAIPEASERVGEMMDVYIDAPQA